MTEPQHPLEYLPELALGVLPEAQAETVRVHISGCDACRDEFEEMARVAALLPLAAEDISPSPSMKDAVLERVALEPRPENAPIELASRRRTPRWLPVASMAAAIAVLVATGVAAFAVGRSSAGETTESGPEAAFVEAAALGTLETASAEASGSRAIVLRVPGHTSAFAWVEGLPALPHGKAYQAWFIGAAGAEPAEVFRNGEGSVWLDADAPVDDYTAIGLTIEDAGGAEQPSDTPFVIVPLERQAKAIE